ncbi:MAG TPA: LPS export ABC transporter periplasmic protein LptC [Pyrinomonadaceae bacterium]|nr:LPS export ABC transporter periplasmic protein LptC [Pyrinomonadaceae bacterium]
MSDAKRPNIQKLQKRANLPKYFRVGAIAALCVTILAIGIGFYLARKNTEFRLKPEHAQLSKDVLAEVNGYERTETDGNLKKFYIKADKATTFTDNHQELENVFLQVFDEIGDKSDQITSEKAIYIPAENKNFTAYFAGNVNIETRDALKVKTAQIVYTKETETAEAEELVEFERENITGKSLGAFVRIKEKKLELMKDVEINAFALNPDDELTKSNIQSAKITANYAMVDQNTEKIELSDNVFINIIPNGQNSEMSQPTDIKSDRAVASFTNKEIKQIDLSGNVDVYQKPTSANSKWTRTKANKATAKIEKELKSVELTENVEIETATNDAKPTKINSGYALYEKDIDRFQLKNGVHIVTVEDNKPTNIKASEAVYEQTNGRIFLNGNSEIDNGTEYLKGDVMTALLFPNKKVKYSNAKGNAYLKQTSAERTTEVSGNELNATFNDNQQLQAANVVGNSNAVLTPVQANEYSKVTLTAPNAIHLSFRGEGLLEQMNTEGRTTIQLNAPKTSADAANKKLTADSVKTFFNANGKDLTKAEAVGNAELYIEPLQNSATNYKTTVNAPRFDCEFFPTGNNAKICIAQTKTKTVRVPTVTSDKRGTQTLIADKLTAQFNQQTQDVQVFDALGNTKFTELDRNGIAERINFTADDEVVRLRGGEPTVWDSRARAKGDEIDWDTRAEKSFLRGNVSTTYYSQKQTGGATPFGETNKPVFVTAANAEFNHTEETGLYTGNARAWQDNNYVRSDKLLLKQKEGQLFAEGSVQSVLYDAKKKEKGKETTVPVYASSNKLFYNRENRQLRYEENVDIRQGTDRITAGKADIYMDDKNEMSKTIAETNVVITQPNRRALGDWAQYTSENEVAILRGNPAKIDDTENGSSQGAQVTVFMRENRVVGESQSEQNNTGRTRSVYKVKKNE